MSSAPEIRALGPNDTAVLRAMLTMFGEAFEDPEAYGSPPRAEYLRRQLERDSFIAIAASHRGEIIGGIAAYELHKFEQERSEIYIYDLAVAETERRQGVATRMIEKLQEIAAARGAWVIFVQADHGDDPAVALYTKLGTREDVMHFDIPVPKPPSERG